MSTEHAMLYDQNAISEMARTWCDVELPEEHALVICSQWQSRKKSHMGCLNDDAISCGAIAWLKNRMAECTGLLRGSGCGAPDIRLSVSLHFYALCEPDADEVRPQPVFARSKMFRSPLAKREPIDAVARRVADVRDGAACSVCGKKFRNSAAHRLHIAERHLERLTHDDNPAKP